MKAVVSILFVAVVPAACDHAADQTNATTDFLFPIAAAQVVEDTLPRVLIARQRAFLELLQNRDVQGLREYIDADFSWRHARPDHALDRIVPEAPVTYLEILAGSYPAPEAFPTDFSVERRTGDRFTIVSRVGNERSAIYTTWHMTDGAWKAFYMAGNLTNQRN